jgi:hypothetical protein
MLSPARWPMTCRNFGITARPSTHGSGDTRARQRRSPAPIKPPEGGDPHESRQELPAQLAALPTSARPALEGGVNQLRSHEESDRREVHRSNRRGAAQEIPAVHGHRRLRWFPRPSHSPGPHLHSTSSQLDDSHSARPSRTRARDLLGPGLSRRATVPSSARHSPTALDKPPRGSQRC